MIILGIESSCDETAVAIVNDKKDVLASELISQNHSIYGGVVPEIASRNHLSCIDNLFNKALDSASLDINDIDAFAVTAGPGLIGGLIIGTMFAKGLAYASGKPLIMINHLEAHVLSVRLVYDLPFPFLTLLISGGHCQIIFAKSIGEYTVMGETLDDALGEAFDKIARVLGLGYPGGPFIEQAALEGDCNHFKFPKPMLNKPGCNFSFSGLKTAVAYKVNQIGMLDRQDICDICASFQLCVTNILTNRLECALTQLDKTISINGIVITGGVAANKYITSRIKECMHHHALESYFPPKHLCTDNAIMIAWAALESHTPGDVYDNYFSFATKPRWSL